MLEFSGPNILQMHQFLYQGQHCTEGSHFQGIKWAFSPVPLSLSICLRTMKKNP